MKAIIQIYLLMGLSLLGMTGCHGSRKSAKESGMGKSVFQVQKLSESNNRFAADLFKQVHTSHNNLIFSPFSISNIMAMVYGGAAGETAVEIARILNFPDEQKLLHPAVKQLGESLDSIDLNKGTEFVRANSIWAQKNFSFLPEYIKITEYHYHAHLEQLDFIHTAEREASRIRINDWVARNTRQRIKDLIQPGVLDESTRMVLTNAVFFNGKWMHPFDKSSTSSSVFQISLLESVKTKFMNQTRAFPYYEDEEVQAVSLPYQGGRMSMLIILPRRTEGWKIFSRILDEERIRRVSAGMVTREVQLAIPRFQSELQINLRKVFLNMGIEKAFSREADLSGMNGEKNLFISEIIHKAFIEVTEAGTEAAAATAGVVGLKSAMPQETVHFRADHPFLYFLIDDVTGCVIFAGRLVKPSGNM